jgi:hypothetical protein
VKKEPSIYCWWKCKLEQPLWKTVWRHLKKTKNRTYYPTIPLLGIRLKDKSGYNKAPATHVYCSIIHNI